MSYGGGYGGSNGYSGGGSNGYSGGGGYGGGGRGGYSNGYAFSLFLLSYDLGFSPERISNVSFCAKRCCV